jgi:hypothetical protein
LQVAGLLQPVGKDQIGGFFLLFGFFLIVRTISFLIVRRKEAAMKKAVLISVLEFVSEVLVNLFASGLAT